MSAFAVPFPSIFLRGIPPPPDPGSPPTPPVNPPPEPAEKPERKLPNEDVLKRIPIPTDEQIDDFFGRTKRKP